MAKASFSLSMETFIRVSFRKINRKVKGNIILPMGIPTLDTLKTTNLTDKDVLS